MIYTFSNKKGVFTLKSPNLHTDLYLPLTNAKGTILSSISPRLAGDIKRNNDHFLTPPASIEDIKHNLLCRRDFFLMFPDKLIRISEHKRSSLEIGMLYQKLFCIYPEIEINITNFVPHAIDAEVMWINIRNRTRKNISFVPTSFIPLYGRGEKNLRDHRHVSSLLNRVYFRKYGVILKPTLSFDENGHHINKTCYFVLGYSRNSHPPLGMFPTLESFCGERGSILMPEAVIKNLSPYKKKIKAFDGKECCAALRFRRIALKPLNEVNFVLIMGIADEEKIITQTFSKLDTVGKVKRELEKTKKYWQEATERLQVSFGNRNYDNWLKWVILQPTLRKLFGCSFLPHFDYGKGGRGWRDLWQDALNLIRIEPEKTKKLILHNFCGVRIDGSNATIITKDNNFISDRNRISRVWMDHGIWPYLALKEYIHTSGDLDILLEKTPYYRDHQIKRAQETDYRYTPADHILRTKKGRIYKGTILEHLLVENLVPFFNVGKHNIIRLENADWNDGLDMAATRGESVAFSCMYAYNLEDIAYLLENAARKYPTVEIFEELLLLLDHINKPINYNNPQEKQKLLSSYLEKTKYSLSGKVKRIPVKSLIRDLREKGRWLKDHIRNQEWLKEGFYNGYYDNKSRRVEGKKNGHIRMMLPSQVFAIMSGVATKNQIRKIWNSIKKHLYDKNLKGFRLNTNFKQQYYMELGRAFAFSYGDKENGAFFNHMNIMLAFALYQRKFIKEAEEVLSSIYSMSTSPPAKIYPMIPEYFNNEGKGLYLYLTGSASWYTHTLLKQILGIQYNFGNLIINPSFTSAFFRNNIAARIWWNNKEIHITYSPARIIKTGIYRIKKAYFNKKEILPHKGKIEIPASQLSFHRSINLHIIAG